MTAKSDPLGITVYMCKGRLGLRLLLILIVTAVLVSAVFGGSAAVAAVPACFNEDAMALPRDAYPLPLERAADIQSALDQYRQVKLQPNGDYSKRGGLIRLSTGQALYGIAGSRVGRIVVEGGASNVVLQGITTSGISFPASDKVTRGNCFRRITGPITVDNAKLEDNLFVDIANTKLDIDTRRSGYLRNNRFIRVLVHAASPALNMRGDTKRLSGGNVFLWFNVLTPHGDGIIIDGQDDVTFVGIDAESWNWSRRATKSAMMTVTNTGVLRVLAANGGDAKSGTGRYLDASADEVQLYGTNIARVGNPAVILRPPMKRFFASNVEGISIGDESLNPFTVDAFSGSKAEILARGVNLSNQSLSAADQTTLRNMFVDRHDPSVAWAKPVLAPIPTPAGPAWRVGIDGKPDSADYLQGLVAAQGIARVPAGIYYISKPIRLRRDQGLIGDGADRTVIIARQPNIDMILGDESMTKNTPGSFTLADITLQGGRNGIHHDVAGAQFNRIVLSHVTFIDMAEAGIFIDGIYGWDNNFIDNVNFLRCGEAGIKQRVNRPYMQGDYPGISYMDKNVFYRCQFIDSGRGVDLQANRANNLNAFIDSVFKRNAEAAASMTHNSSTVFANSDFISNGGDPVISNDRPTYFVNDYFRAVRDNVSMLPDDATCDGCLFEKGGATDASIVAHGIRGAALATGAPRTFLYNSKSVDMSLGKIRTGILVNNFLAQDRSLSVQAAFVRAGQVKVVMPGAPTPSSQFLFRRNYDAVPGK